MTALTGRVSPHTSRGPGRGGRERVGRLARTEARLLWRFGVVAATAVVTGLWIAVVRVVPAPARSTAAAIVLLTDVAALGFLFVPALLVLERLEGIEAALHVTPVRPGERVTARIAMITGLSITAGLGVCLGAGVANVPPRIAGVALLAALLGLTAYAVTATSATLTDVLMRAPLVAAPLIAPALAHLAGLTTSPALYASPVTSAVDLLLGRTTWSGIAWLTLWTVVTAAWIVRAPRRSSAATRPASSVQVSPSSRPWPGRGRRYRPRTAIRSFARADRRTLVRDGMLVALVVSVPLLTGVTRLVASVGAEWARQRHGVALVPHLPLIEGLLLVVHTPVVFGSLTGLLMLEDRDAGLFGPLHVTRAGLSTLLAYRLGVTALLTTTALAAMLPLDGVPHPAGAAGTTATAVAAGAVSVVPALLMAATATNRVQGVAVMKGLGLPLYLPLATWFMDGPARWAFVPLPTSWVLWTSWAATPSAAVSAAVVGVAVSLVCTVVLMRRLHRRASAV
ncbi:MAG TPA: hypothetical protein VFZ70_10245 [Euzebyales bacterium]